MRAARRCSKLSCKNCRRIFFNSRLSRESIYCVHSFNSGVFDIAYQCEWLFERRICGNRHIRRVSSDNDNERKRNCACRICVSSVIVGNFVNYSITFIEDLHESTNILRRHVFWAFSSLSNKNEVTLLIARSYSNWARTIRL